MQAKSSPRVAIVGGGIAGLVAAWELSGTGVQVELYEGAAALGGRIHTREILGQRFDVGAESFALRGGGVGTLIEDLGLGDRIQRPNALRSWVIHPEISAPLPAAGMIGIPVAPLSRDARRILGLCGALRASFEPLLPKRVGRRAKSVAEAVRARFGPRVLSQLVAPVVRGVYSTDPAALKLSAIPGLEQAWRKHRSLTAAARAQRQSTQAAGAAVASLDGGMGALVDELERQLAQRSVALHLHSTVTAVRKTDAGLRLDVQTDTETDTETGADTGAETLVETAPFQAVIVTAPGVTADGVRAETPSTEPLSAAAPSRGETTVEVVALLLDNALLNDAPRGTGALVAAAAQQGPHRIHAKALTHSSAKWAWLAKALPRDRHLMRLSYGEHSAADSSSAHAHTLALTDDETLRLACADAARILGVPICEDQILGMVRQRHTIPHRDQVPAPSGASAGGTEGVFYAGEWVSGTGLAAVIPAARATARDCAAFIAQTAQLSTEIEHDAAPAADRHSSDPHNSHVTAAHTPREREVLP